MTYTVKKLAKLSGVSERTLRWYDAVGVLKPAYYGDNGYRYYETEQLLLLQQILFFRELDFPLDEIRRIITGSDFDKLKALTLHKKTLQRSLERIKDLIKTIDKTTLHIQGKKMMQDKDMYKGFYDWAEGKGGESYFIGKIGNSDDPALKLVLKSAKHKNEHHDKSYYEDILKEVTDIYRKLSECIDDGLSSTSSKVQGLIKKHYAFTQRFHDATKTVYKALAKVYREHPDFRKQIDPSHPQLAEFLSEAMDAFANKNL